MTALCRHFGSCGGCAFQDLHQDAYGTLKCAQVAKALARHGIEAPVAPLADTLPRSRRRTSLKAVKKNGTVAIGFNAARSHAIVDMRECLVLTPALYSLVAGLRELLGSLLSAGEQAEITVTETDSGFDLELQAPANEFVRDAAPIALWARGRSIARIFVNGEIAVQHATPAICIGDADVHLPRGAFLQSSRESERILQNAVLAITAGARRIVDLFCGCGTFALVMAKRARVHAVDLDAEAVTALADAARRTKGLKPVTAETRNLFKRPLRPEELDGFDAVVIDPPRAGAIAQAGMLAQSGVQCLAYVSCNPETFARDAAVLLGGGFQLCEVRPVDQFLWSKHIEIVGAFERKSGWSRRRIG